MTKKKTDPVLLQIASDVAQLEARMESVTQSAVAQQGHIEQRMRQLESRFAADLSEPVAEAGDVYNITVENGGQLTIHNGVRD